MAAQAFRAISFAGEIMRHMPSLPLAAALLAGLSTVAHAEKLPKPTVDFAAEGTITSGKEGSSPATMRQSGGRLRLDTQAKGHPTSLFVDIASHTATVVSERMGQKIAMKIDPERAAEAINFLDRDAKRVGEARIAGESCDEFEFETGKNHTIRACITHDGISLRARDMSRHRVLWEARSVTRAPQNADIFIVPRDAVPLQIPTMK
jgi:hypothetical protein